MTSNSGNSDLMFKIQCRLSPTIRIDLLTLIFQFLLVEVCIASIFMWITQWSAWGTPDVTIHWWFYKNGWATQEMPMYSGIGIHWSTLFYFAFATLNLSFYLSKKVGVIGIHNAAYSLIVGFWVSSMVFELPYVFLMDGLHNMNEVTRFPIWLSGWNTLRLGASGQAGAEAPRWIMVAAILYPLTVSTSILLAFRRWGSGLIQKYGFTKTKNLAYSSFVVSYIATLVATIGFCLTIGIFPVIIRNLGWFFGLITAYVLLLDAVQNPASPSFKGEMPTVSFRFTDKPAIILFAAFIIGYAIWIFYPISPLNNIFPVQTVKGYWFPQTVYAFYQSDVPIISNQTWVDNAGIWMLNHMVVKPLATFWTVWALAPKITGAARRTTVIEAPYNKSTDMNGSNQT